MTESPFVKAEGPEPPDEEVLLKEKHRETMAGLEAAVLDQLKTQSIMHIPENTATILVDDSRYGYAYYREQQMQPDMSEIEQVRAEVYRGELELSRQRHKLAQATDEINRLTQTVQRYESKALDNYQLIGQLVGFLDSIEWGTHDEWTRSQSLRERAHEYVESFTVSNTNAT